VWPGDRAFTLDQYVEGGFVLDSVSTTCHVGTHLDAPRHLNQTAAGIERVEIDRCIGEAEIVRIPRSFEAVTSLSLPEGWEPTSPRVLLRSDSYPIDGAPERGFSGVSAELVHWLADRGVILVGVDTPSVDVFNSEGFPAHHALLERDVTWIEGLWLADAEPGRYLLVALPILLEGAGAAPVRAVLRPLRG
jgi:arylformamidase